MSCMAVLQTGILLGRRHALHDVCLQIKKLIVEVPISELSGLLRGQVTLFTFIKLYMQITVNNSMMSPTLPFDWSRRTRVDWTTSESLSDIQDKLRDPLGYNLDDGQLRGIDTILNGTGLLFLRATEDGKSTLIYGPLMTEPGIVAIIALPTESDQVRSMGSKGVTAAAINQCTLRAAAPASPSCDLWDKVRKGKYQATFCSPELLISPAFDKLLEDKGFFNRLAIFLADECQGFIKK
ncbi:hypothetical protein BS47DRAFT_203255 [Hydnum rufescens UP504]|uniref:Uncharacterized protein n=1 Tax=Hydnum rufescens UP504 TaxID=1448309 RepID=A0A9P6ANS5_9AGAM|nr:hypothetical protein BS47DRAFT_203255 [Hydnum rufescens UP504]